MLEDHAELRWNGMAQKVNHNHLLLLEGVTFDTGGYSLKPAKFMEDMTYDMAGSAAVVGLMKTLALKKQKLMRLVSLDLLRIW